MVAQKYVDSNQRTIQEHSSGLKLVLGGTGLGKTSSIKEGIQVPKYRERKFLSKGARHAR